jgi:hypothetical protein
MSDVFDRGTENKIILNGTVKAFHEFNMSSIAQ